jgi:hypothetical protein
VEFWYEAVKAGRGIAYMKGAADMKNLKRVLDLKVITETELEQLALFFLHDPSCKKLPPTIAVFLSGGVLTGLQNVMKNDGERFWPRVERYSQQYLKRPKIEDAERQKIMHSLSAMRDGLRMAK